MTTGPLTFFCLLGPQTRCVSNRKMQDDFDHLIGGSVCPHTNEGMCWYIEFQCVFTTACLRHKNFRMNFWPAKNLTGHQTAAYFLVLNDFVNILHNNFCHKISFSFAIHCCLVYHDCQPFFWCNFLFAQILSRGRTLQIWWINKTKCDWTKLFCPQRNLKLAKICIRKLVYWKGQNFWEFDNRGCLHDTGSSLIRNEKQHLVPCLHESVSERTHTERGLTK